MSTILAPFQLLEINVISAQDLEPVCRRRMRTYAVAWVHQERKLSTRIDTQGHTNPTWNDKFVFRVDDEFLRGDTSSVMIEIYAVHWFRDIHVGTVRAIVGNIVPPVSRATRNRNELRLGMRFVALQVRRNSGRPQGILNIGVALLDSSMRSMPLYLQMGSSAVGYRHLMGEEDPFQTSNNNAPLSSTNKSNANNHILLNGSSKPELRRTKSESSSVFASEFKPVRSTRGSSVVNGGSMINGSIINGSTVNGSEIVKNSNFKLNSRGSSMVNVVFEKKPKKGKPAGSIVNGIEEPVKSGFEQDTNVPKHELKSPPVKSPPGGYYGAPRKLGGPIVWTDSELGPSPSEVAAAVAKNMYHNKMDGAESSIVEGWSLDESIEGLGSKLERWRTELPPVYDRGGEVSSYVSTGVPASKKRRPVRRHSADSGGGLFSCFGNFCGCEISITCGPGGAAQARKKGNFHGTPTSSVDNWSFI